MSLQLNAQTALGLLSLSDEYLLASLTTICERTIAEQVTSKLAIRIYLGTPWIPSSVLLRTHTWILVENVGSVLSTADRFHAATLKKFCMDFILSNFNAVLNCSDFQESVKVVNAPILYVVDRELTLRFFS
jgi:hypothetical protein